MQGQRVLSPPIPLATGLTERVLQHSDFQFGFDEENDVRILGSQFSSKQGSRLSNRQSLSLSQLFQSPKNGDRLSLEDKTVSLPSHQMSLQHVSQGIDP